MMPARTLGGGESPPGSESESQGKAPMKPAPFEYLAPTSVGEAIAALQEFDGEAKILAGGQSLMPMLNMRLARPGLVVDLRRVADLDYIDEREGRLAIGAMTTKRTVERSAAVQTGQPLLHAATVSIGHPQIRNRGTVGGSMAQADPAAEYPAMAVALQATLTVGGPGGERTLDAEDFFVTYLTTALEPGEVLTELNVPVFDTKNGWGFSEIARRHGDFAMAGAAVTLTLDDNGCCAEPRIALFGVGATPVRPRTTEDSIRGQRPSEALCQAAGKQVSEEIDEPLSDVHASADYRRNLAGVMARRALADAMRRLGADIASTA